MSQANSYLADLVGAFGDPIAENPTGVIQEAAFRALDLNWRYLTMGTAADFQPWTSNHRVPDGTEILVNATSIGLFPEIEAVPEVDFATIRPGMVVCDVIPNPPRTRFLAMSEERGATTLDGLGMLVYQGAIAFTMWTGREAPTDVMHRALREVFD
jgi:shikimate dehydrogenase